MSNKSFANDKEPRFFKSNYAGLSISKTEPTQFSEENFGSGNRTLSVLFRHILRDRWLVGVQSGFKDFDIKGSEQHLHIFYISQDSTLLTRLGHPLYLGLGSKLMYLLPTQRQGIPPKSHANYEREIGGGLTVSLIIAPSRDWFMALSVERWRGFSSQRFHAFDTAMALYIALP